MKKRSLIIFTALVLVPLILFAQISGSSPYASFIRSFLSATTTAAARTAIGAVGSGSGGALTNAVIYGSTSGNVTFGSTGSFIGTGTANGLNVATPVSEFHVGSTSTSSPRGIMSAQYSTGTNGARIHMRKARGSEASPTVVTTADDLGNLLWSGYDGSSFLEMASIRGIATGTIAANRVPTQLIFSTATDASPSVLTDALWINSNQQVGIGAAASSTLLQVGAGTPTTAASGIQFGTDTVANLYRSTSSIIKSDGWLNGALGLIGVTGQLSTIYPTGVGTDLKLQTRATGSANIIFYSVGTTPTESARFTTAGDFGVGTTAPDKKVEINSSTGAVFRGTYNDSNGSAANYFDLSVSSSGDLTIAPSGGDVSVTGRTASTPASSTLAAAATTLAITRDVMTITGDGGGNTLATITGGLSGQLLTLIFADALVTITDDATATANTVNLSAAFTSTANDTLTLVFDGTSWREVARSVN